MPKKGTPAAENSRNITVEKELVELIRQCQQKMEAELGFYPNQSQCIKRLIRQYATTPQKEK